MSEESERPNGGGLSLTRPAATGSHHHTDTAPFRGKLDSVTIEWRVSGWQGLLEAALIAMPQKMWLV
jgi:hypothetical protein